eukprot:scaffold115521_cov63-Phaeocystis_antarctica.AAC.7
MARPTHGCCPRCVAGHEPQLDCGGMRRRQWRGARPRDRPRGPRRRRCDPRPERRRGGGPRRDPASGRTPAHISCRARVRAVFCRRVASARPSAATRARFALALALAASVHALAASARAFFASACSWRAAAVSTPIFSSSAASRALLTFSACPSCSSARAISSSALSARAARASTLARATCRSWSAWRTSDSIFAVDSAIDTCNFST